jgi:lysophospholipid acyltransferase
VYERLTPKGKKPSFKTLLATQLVAGAWHGLFPGYALFFASSAFLFEAGKARGARARGGLGSGCAG